MIRVYVLFLDTTFFDFDTHYDSELLGIYSTKELAEEAMNNLDIEQIEAQPFVDNFEIRIEPYVLDENTNYDKREIN